ncbi:MAG TPA: hypothetical protein VK589_11805 [Chryseolinea sp.]|nr:hypothetical protein [Chryseolinea sp.]
MQDLKQFAFQVEQMRIAQIDYFQQIGKARKTKTPGDWAAAATTLKRSKQLEKVVDDSIAEFRKEIEL